MDTDTASAAKAVALISGICSVLVINSEREFGFFIKLDERTYMNATA
jgi:hypothetical protein